MTFPKANRAYELWLANHIELIPADLRRKRALMGADSFSFLRATFFRWAQRWTELASDLAGMPEVLAVGDLHVENFGLWRDADGRLAWGINDFDEACLAPYGNDLVRLAASIRLAGNRKHLGCKWSAACDAILDGYTASLELDGRPVVLAENNSWLRSIAGTRMRDHRKYWARFEALKSVEAGVSKEARELLKSALPARGIPFRIVHRQAGLGSLGRHRFLALADWHGGKVGREVKSLAPSAWHWLDRHAAQHPIRYGEILSVARRSPDPHLQHHGKWVVRRLAPDCSRIELSSLPEERDELKLLYMMGWETANIHLGSRRAKQLILADLGRRKSKWLKKTAETATMALEADWREWKRVTA